MIIIMIVIFGIEWTSSDHGLTVILIMLVIDDYELVMILVMVVMLEANMISRNYGLAMILVTAVMVLASAGLLDFGCINPPRVERILLRRIS